MRIVIDLQGAQTESRFRGIGRYSLSFVRALLNQRSRHDFWVVLNGRFGESIGEIEEALADVLPRDHVRVFETPPGVALRENDCVVGPRVQRVVQRPHALHHGVRGRQTVLLSCQSALCLDPFDSPSHSRWH